MKKLLLLLALDVSFITAGSAQRASQADLFVDSIGVNTHFTYTNTVYGTHWSTVFAALEKLHVRHIRDGFYAWPVGNSMYTKHKQLHAAGIDCDYVVGAIPTAEQVETVKVNAEDMLFLEAPNEMDDQKGANWAAVLHASMPALYKAGSANRVSVLGPALVYQKSYAIVGDMADDMNYNNLHIYFGGRNPGSPGWGSTNAEHHSYGSIAWWLDNGQIDGPDTTSVVTESGYLANTVVTPYTLPQNIEAKYAQRTMLEMFNAGVHKSYFYQLVDEVTSPGYGLMNESLQPKLAYTAISNLLGLLEDPGASFIPAGLAYTLTGAASDVHHLLLQKRDGSFYLVLWIEESGYNEVTNVVTPVPSQKVQLALTDAKVEDLYTFNDHGAYTTTVEKKPTSLELTLKDTVTIVKIAAD